MRNKRKRDTLYKPEGTETGTVTFTVTFRLNGDPTEAALAEMLERRAEYRDAANWLKRAAIVTFTNSVNQAVNQTFEQSNISIEKKYLPKSASSIMGSDILNEVDDSLGLKFGKRK